MTDYPTALVNFLKLIAERSAKYYDEYYTSLEHPTYEVIKGRKYDRVIQTSSGNRSAYCWLNPATGDILKGSWKAIEDKRPRGNIYNENPLAGTDIYGVSYLK